MKKLITLVTLIFILPPSTLAFKPQLCVNRAGFMKMMQLTNESTLNIGDINPFTDVDSSAWYFPYVKSAFENKIIEGYPDGTF
jgi:hypothetical protein